MEIPPAREEWVRAQRMDAASRTARVLAHEIANYLGSTRSMLYLLAEEIGPDPRSRADLDSVVRTVDSATRLVAALRGFAHAPTLGNGSADLNDVVAEVEAELQGLMPAGKTLTVERAPGPLIVKADAPRLRQLVLDLVAGANHALPVGGLVEVETGLVPDPGGGSASLVVRDDAPGLEPDAAARIFEPYVFDPAYDTGLRLPTIYATVARSGGTISGDSAPGTGTTIRVTLPLAAAARAGRS
ncbi:MAG TPA: HAMP domain-containing sensor histidine kinase [Gemmatimonadales bacterium]|nr:HAMP domain-containing sensor histidine kinase [Gemmatimonadales bacterium]